MNFSSMRKFFLLTAIALLLIGGCDRATDGIHTLDIYVTSDVHGYYLSRYYLDDSIRPNSLSKVSTVLSQARETNPDAILIDNGDNLQGDNSAFYYNFVDTASQHIFAKMANYLHYDAIVVGNHDIEAGHSVYDRVRKQFEAPLLAANAIITEGPDKGKCYFQEYTVVKKNGLKVAIIGFTNPNIPHWVTEPLYHGMEFKTVSDMAQELVNRIRSKEHPDVVIVSMHCGSGTDNSDSVENCALYMAKTLEGVDVVIGGHDHRARQEAYCDKEIPTVYLNPGARCNNIAHVRLDITIEKGKRTAGTFQSEIIPLADVPADAAFDTAFEADYDAVKQFTLRKICNVGKTFDLSDALDGPSEYMQLLYDVQMAATGADITFAAPLSSSGVIKEGEMVYNDLTRIYPFENKLFTIAMTGAQIKSYLEYSYDRWLNREGPAYCYDSAGGLNYSVYKKRPVGSRVAIEALSDGRPFKEDGTYRVAVTSYRAMGGDGLLAAGAGLDTDNPDSYILEKYGDIRELLYDYLMAQDTFEPQVCDNWKFID